jgi:hypothetical protein
VAAALAFGECDQVDVGREPADPRVDPDRVGMGRPVHRVQHRPVDEGPSAAPA